MIKPIAGTMGIVALTGSGAFKSIKAMYNKRDGASSAHLPRTFHLSRSRKDR